jgi:hypothetical protein
MFASLVRIKFVKFVLNIRRKHFVGPALVEISGSPSVTEI